MSQVDDKPRPGSSRWAQAEPIARVMHAGGTPKVMAATMEQADRLVHDAVFILNEIEAGRA